MVRFYLQQKEDPHGPSVALFVGNLPIGLSDLLYEKILMESLKNNNDIKWNQFDVVYHEYGSVVLLYDDSEKAVKAYRVLKEACYENKQLMVLLLPTIQVSYLGHEFYFYFFKWIWNFIRHQNRYDCY